MSSAPILFTQRNGAQDRTIFNSGSEPLDKYLREQVSQDVRRRVPLRLRPAIHWLMGLHNSWRFTPSR